MHHVIEKAAMLLVLCTMDGTGANVIEKIDTKNLDQIKNLGEKRKMSTLLTHVREGFSLCVSSS
jgi:hypothetical protein